MQDSYDGDFEDAVRFLAERMPNVDKLTKPTLLHSLRVGIRLYNLGYSKNIAIAGLLHDLIEDAEVSTEEIAQRFGTEIADLVKAESKDSTIGGEIDKIDELIQRCATNSEDAAIIKAVDIMDNLNYFKNLDEPKKMEKLLRMANMLLEKIPPTYMDFIFKTLKDTKDS